MESDRRPERMSLLDAIADKKNRLDRLRPLPPEALSNLEHYYDLEITYTSNAIVGNTLSPLETTLVIDKAVTISAKPSTIPTPFATSARWPAIKRPSQR